MRDLTELNAYRSVQDERMLAAMFGHDYSPTEQPWGGCFYVRSDVDGYPLKVIASRGNALHDERGEPWHHASVSRADRCPTWEEMEQIKRLFWPPDAVCMQLHVAESEHISVHSFCLHIWQPVTTSIPLPPSWMVG